MLFLLLGVGLLVLNLAGIGPVGQWTWETHWWALGAPFLAAALWWMVADLTGLTSRRAMAKDAARRQARRERHLDAMGKATRKKR